MLPITSWSHHIVIKTKFYCSIALAFGEDLRPLSNLVCYVALNDKKMPTILQFCNCCFHVDLLCYVQSAPNSQFWVRKNPVNDRSINGPWRKWFCCPYWRKWHAFLYFLDHNRELSFWGNLWGPGALAFHIYPAAPCTTLATLQWRLITLSVSSRQCIRT